MKDNNVLEEVADIEDDEVAENGDPNFRCEVQDHFNRIWHIQFTSRYEQS
jgi:hypothetical protein